MIKLQDFAAMQGVTDRQINRLLQKYASELEGLFERRGHNGTWLTDEACEILRSKMKQQPVVVSEGSDRVAALEEENKQLLLALNAAKDRIIDLQEQNTALALKTAKIELLEADNASVRERATQAEERAQAASDELVEAQRRIAELEGRKWWQLLFKKKG